MRMTKRTQRTSWGGFQSPRRGYTGWRTTRDWAPRACLKVQLCLLADGEPLGEERTGPRPAKSWHSRTSALGALRFDVAWGRQTPRRSLERLAEVPPPWHAALARLLSIRFHGIVPRLVDSAVFSSGSGRLGTGCHARAGSPEGPLAVQQSCDADRARRAARSRKVGPRLDRSGQSRCPPIT